MVTLIMMIQNQREEQILKAAFEQRGVKVILAKATYQNYVLMLQYMPDIVFMELPHICTEQLAFAKRLRAFKRTKTIPIAGYGDKIDDMVKRGISQHGFTVYIERPIKYSSLLQTFNRLFKAHGKSFDAPLLVTDKEKDLDLIMNSNAPPMQKIEAMIRHVASLLAFPFSVAKVLQITQSELSGAQNLAYAIVSDPSISAHILKVANSVFFASSNRRINSIKDAIVRIGFNETRKIVMSMQVMKLFEKNSKTNGFDRIDFWYHSVTVALISEKIARLIGNVNPETAFLAGLLHDLGIILLDEYFLPVFDRALELTSQRGGHFIDVQKELYGVTHNDLISGLFPMWKIPQEITDSILYQFRISEYNNTFDTIGKRITLCVALGSIIAKTLHQGKECDEFVYPLPNELFKAACLPSGVDKKLLKQIFEDLALYQSFLGLEKRVFSCDVCGIEQPSNFKIAFFSPNPWIFIPPEMHLHQIGFETMRIDSLSKITKEIDCTIIWDPEGTLTFNDETLFSEKHRDITVVNKNKKPVIFIGSSLEAPAHVPDGFTYLPSSLDLRVLDITTSRLVAHPEPQKRDRIDRESVSDDLVTRAISDLDESLDAMLNTKETADESD